MMKYRVMIMDYSGKEKIYETTGDKNSFICPICKSSVQVTYCENIPNVNLPCNGCNNKFGIVKQEWMK